MSWITAATLNKPVPLGLNSTTPASYIAHADHMYQYVARYGSTKVADATLKLAANEPRISGMNLITYFENWNEQDCWWDGKNSYFSPEEFSAMASADYDGHQGKLGANIGVKNADKNAKMVMGGLAELDLNYVKSMKTWADANRNGVFPADVINFHHYCNDGNGQDDNATVGISPEAEMLKEKMMEITSYRDRVLPGKEVWLSEFGYDTHPNSIFRAPKIGSYSQQEVQGQWLVRSYLALAAAGVDKGMMYMLRDVDPNSTIKFSTSGLTSSMNLGHVPKISWYYMYTLKNTLKGMKFIREEKSTNTKVNIYAFKNAKGENGSYAVWANTSSGTIINDFEITLPSGVSSATLITMKEGDTDGVASPLTITNGKAKISVSERPVYVMVSTMPILGISDSEEQYNFKVFPTVTTEEVAISLDANLVGNSIKYEILDTRGVSKYIFNTTYTGETMHINMSNFTSGLYIVSVQCDSHTFSGKVMKY